MSDKTTAQVAQELGSTRKLIIATLRRYPELKSAKRLDPSQDFWGMMKKLNVFATGL
jgi:hypothetical protein